MIRSCLGHGVSGNVPPDRVVPERPAILAVAGAVINLGLLTGRSPAAFRGEGLMHNGSWDREGGCFESTGIDFPSSLVTR